MPRVPKWVACPAVQSDTAALMAASALPSRGFSGTTLTIEPARAQVVTDDLHGQHRRHHGRVQRVAPRRGLVGQRVGARIAGIPARGRNVDDGVQMDAGTDRGPPRGWRDRCCRTRSRRRRVPWRRPRDRRGGRRRSRPRWPASRKPSAIVRPRSVSPPVTSTSIARTSSVFNAEPQRVSAMLLDSS